LGWNSIYNFPNFLHVKILKLLVLSTNNRLISLIESLKKFKTLILKIATKRDIWWVLIYYRGYILIRLKIIDKQQKIVEKIDTFQLRHPHKDWKIIYIIPIHGECDMIVECVFRELENLNVILNFCRTDNELINWIEATTTFISIKKDFIL
jgi:hypothetical protein